jgi:HEAT repeat protein
MKMHVTSGQKNRERHYRPALVLFVVLSAMLACFAGDVSAQDIGLLTYQVRSGSTEQKRSALAEIRNLRTEVASRAAVPALSDPDEIIRATAASAVIYLPKDEAARLILPLLGDKPEFTRREAAFALGEVGSPVATDALVRMLVKDSENIVRSAAAAALGKIGDSSAVDALADVLKRKPKAADEYLRRSAARSIGQIAEAVRGGRRQTATPQSFLPEKYKANITSDAATAAFPAFRKAVGVLLNVASNARETDDTRREAAYALGSVGDASSVAFLKANLTNKDNYLAEICKEALLKLPRSE